MIETLSPQELRDKIGAFKNRDEITSILKPGGIGIELGIATGNFSARLLRKSKLEYLYSVDRYSGENGHDIDQYRQAVKMLEPFRQRNSVLKMGNVILNKPKLC